MNELNTQIKGWETGVKKLEEQNSQMEKVLANKPKKAPADDSSIRKNLDEEEDRIVKDWGPRSSTPVVLGIDSISNFQIFSINGSILPRYGNNLIVVNLITISYNWAPRYFFSLPRWLHSISQW